MIYAQISHSYLYPFLLSIFIQIAGFIVKDESIDVYEQHQGDDESSAPSLSSEKNKYNMPAQQINVYDRKVLYNSDDTDDEEETILDENIWKVLQPWIPKITPTCILILLCYCTIV